jgi:hypothetical protein
MLVTGSGSWNDIFITDRNLFVCEWDFGKRIVLSKIISDDEILPNVVFGLSFSFL